MQNVIDALKDKDGKLSSRRVLALLLAVNFMIVADVSIILGTHTSALLDFVWYMELLCLAALTGNVFESFIRNRYGSLPNTAKPHSDASQKQ
jgi:hypothetical protein